MDQRGRGATAGGTPSISLTNQGIPAGTLRVNLRWNTRPAQVTAPQQASFRRWLVPRRLEAVTPDYAHTVDLDLGCFYTLVNGRRGVVQAMGGQHGAFEAAPYIRLDRDDKTGSSTGENLFVNLHHHAEISRALIYVYIYSSMATFAQTDAVVSLHPASGPATHIALDTPESAARSCAVVLLTHDAAGEMVARRETRYSAGYQAEIDAMYHWGLRWSDADKHR